MEKVIAHDPSIGYVTKESRTPRRATGTFVPPIEGQQTPRRSPRLLAKRRQGEDRESTAISTPIREAVRKAVHVKSTQMFEYFMNIVSKYNHLRSSSVKASSNNKLASYVVASRTTLVDDECVGPHDAVRLVVCENGKYKFMVYEHLLKEGTVEVSGTNSELEALLKEMNDSCWGVCRGIADYSQYQSSIGYDIKRVKSACWPPNTARDCECAIWFRKESSSHSDLCDRCVRLKWQLAARKKSCDDLSSSDRLTRQSASSSYPFQYLSPHSKKIKLDNMRQAIHKVSIKAQGVDRLSIPDSQGGEIAEVVRTIHDTEQGQYQLKQIFSEADQSGGGRGELLKEIWDRDVSDMTQFSQDQKNNGGLCHTEYIFKEDS